MNKIHYSPSLEWGSSKTRCGRYYTCDVNLTAIKSKVTCFFCKKGLKQKTMNEIEILKEGFNYLKEGFRHVALEGFVSKIDIPNESVKDTITKGLFDHSYEELKNYSHDDCDCFGDIYLPLNGTDWMKFNVSS